MASFLRLKVILGFYLLCFSVETTRASSSQRSDRGSPDEQQLRECFAHCQDSHGRVTEFVVPRETLISLDPNRREERRLSLDHVFDCELLRWNQRLFQMNLGGHYPNHAFLSFEISFRGEARGDGMPQYRSIHFVLVYHEPSETLVFIDARRHEKALAERGYSYADFCNHAQSVKKTTFRSRVPDRSLDVHMIEASSDILSYLLPRERINWSLSHSEALIFSQVFSDPKILKSAFDQIESRAKIKSLVFRVHSALDCCHGCQQTLQYVPLLTRRFLLRNPEVIGDHQLFSKKGERKNWMIPVLVTACNSMPYRKNEYTHNKKNRGQSGAHVGGCIHFDRTSTLRPCFVPAFVKGLSREESQEKDGETDLREKDRGEGLRSFYGDFDGQRLRFRELPITRDGDCGFRGLGISREQALHILLEHSGNEQVRAMVADDIREAVEVGELPDEAVFRSLAEIHQNLVSVRESVDFWTRVVNGNLRRSLDQGSLTAEGILAYVENHPDVATRHRRNIEGLREAVDFQRRLEAEQEAMIERPETYDSFLRDYLLHGGWLSYVRGGRGIVSALADVLGINVFIWTVNEENREELSLVHQSENARAHRTVHLLHTDLMTHFNLLSVVSDENQQELAEENDNALQLGGTIPSILAIGVFSLSETRF